MLSKDDIEQALSKLIIFLDNTRYSTTQNLEKYALLGHLRRMNMMKKIWVFNFLDGIGDKHNATAGTLFPVRQF